MTNPIVIDHKVHWYPPAAIERLIGRTAYPTVDHDADYTLWLDENISQPLMDQLATELENHLAHATDAGIDVLVLGPATMGEVMHLSTPEAVELLGNIHAEYAQAQRKYPGQVVALAAIPMQNPAVALKVLDNAIGELDLRGVSLLPDQLLRRHSGRQPRRAPPRRGDLRHRPDRLRQRLPLLPDAFGPRGWVEEAVGAEAARQIYANRVPGLRLSE